MNNVIYVGNNFTAYDLIYIRNDINKKLYDNLPSNKMEYVDQLQFQYRKMSSYDPLMMMHKNNIMVNFDEGRISASIFISRGYWVNSLMVLLNTNKYAKEEQKIKKLNRAQKNQMRRFILQRIYDFASKI
jgi:hypothetical protein